jgi:hypothetical protein
MPLTEITCDAFQAFEDTKPDEYFRYTVVEAAHTFDLMFSFSKIILFNTHSINPQKLHGKQLSGCIQRFEQIVTHKESVAIE